MNWNSGWRNTFVWVGSTGDWRVFTCWADRKRWTGSRSFRSCWAVVIRVVGITLISDHVTFITDYHSFNLSLHIMWIISCQCEMLLRRSWKGGFGGYPGHDPHLLYTLSAIQILAIYDALDRIDHNQTILCTITSNLIHFLFINNQFG